MCIADQIWAKIGPDAKRRPLRLDPSECAVQNGRLRHQRAKMPRPRLSVRRAEKRNGAVRPQQREADHVVEMGHPNATSVRDLDISCVIAQVLTFIRWDPMDCH